MQTQAAAEAGGSGGKENPPDRQRRAQLLREQTVRRVLSSNTLDTVKAHLRAQLYAELKGSSIHGGRVGRAAPSLRHHVLNCLVAEYLLSRQHRYTLSVFLAESGSDSLPQLSRDDILRLVGVLPESKVHALLGGASEENRAAAAVAEGSGDGGSLAEVMVAALGQLGGHISTHAAACQTCECEDPSSGAGTASFSAQQLEQRLAQIEEEYQRRGAALEQVAAASLGERAAAYQRECDARCEAQLQERLGEMRAGELALVREQEAGRHRQQLEAERLSLQQAHQERLAKLHAQEEELLERSRRQHRKLDALREDHLRRMRAEEERVQAWKAEGEAKLAAAQAAARQQLDQAQAAEQRATTAAQAAEEHLQARQADVQQREQAVARMQAAAEAELGRVATLQQQLAEALQEQGSLRQQLVTGRAAHQADSAELKAELQALRQERDRLVAAAAAASTLPCQVDDLQPEAETLRQREQLWKESAAQAEKLLGKAAKLQERTLRHGEELRLVLAAASREVGDLQQQAALAGAGAQGPLAAALQAACRDAQRWQEGVEARLSAARQEEEDLRQEGAQLRQRALTIRTNTAKVLQQLLAARMQDWQQPGQDEGDSPELSPAVRQDQHAAEPHATTVPVEVPKLPAASMTIAVSALPKQQGQHPPPPEQHNHPLPAAAPPQAAPQSVPPQQEPAAPAAVNVWQGGSLWQHVQPQGLPLRPQPQQSQQSPRQELPTAGATTKPPSRTASDILAAYRARQQRGSASGGTAVPASSRSVSQEVSDTSAGHNEGASIAGSAEHEVAGAHAAHAAPPAAPVAALSATAAGTAAGEGGVGQLGAAGSYYVDEFSSEDSNRF